MAGGSEKQERIERETKAGGENCKGLTREETDLSPED